MTKEHLHFETHIFSCNNERPAGHPRGCCKEKGADDLRNYLKASIKEAGLPRARVNASGCLDRCEAGPVFVVYPEGLWYTAQSRADIDEIVAALKSGTRAERLLLDRDQKELRPEQKAGCDTAVC